MSGEKKTNAGKARSPHTSLQIPAQPFFHADALNRLLLAPRDLPRDPTRFPHAQFRLQLQNPSLTNITRNPTNQKLHSLNPQLPLGQFHSSQPRPKNSQPRIIIKTNQSKIVRTHQPHLFRGLQNPHSKKMIPHKNPTGLVQKKSFPTPKASLDPETPLNPQFRIGREPR